MKQIGPENRSRFVTKKRDQQRADASDIATVLPLIRQGDMIILASHWDATSARR